MTPTEKPPSYRFSDVVRAIGSTPKSFRRWLVTLGIESEDGGWHLFTPAQILEFAIMRHLVNWGVTVVDAAELAPEVMSALLTGGDHSSMDLEEFQARIAESDIPKLTMKQLVGRLAGQEVYIVRMGDKVWAEYSKNLRKGLLGLAGKASPPSHAGAEGSFLTLRLSQLAYAVDLALNGEDKE